MNPMPPNRRWRDRRFAPATGTVLCALDDLTDPGAREFRFGEGRRAFSMIVVRGGGGVFGYLNVCPHFQLPLDAPARPGRFLSADGRRLKCAHHLGLFDIATGQCFYGPPEGDQLTAIRLTVADGQIVVAGGA